MFNLQLYFNFALFPSSSNFFILYKIGWTILLKTYLTCRCQTLSDNAVKTEKTLMFTKELKNTTKEAGDLLRLRCEVAGSVPASSISWFKNDGPILEEQNRVRIFSIFPWFYFLLHVVWSKGKQYKGISVLWKLFKQCLLEEKLIVSY